MDFLNCLMLLVLVLCFAGTQGKCGKQETDAILACISPHMMHFVSFAISPFCARHLITQDICTKFADIVRCVNGVELSSECVRDSAKELGTNMRIACKLNDFQEVCINAPALRTEIDLSAQSLPVGKDESGASYGTGYAVQTTTSPAKIKCTKKEIDVYANCLLPHMLSFSPVLSGSSCDKNLISKDICKRVADVAQCFHHATATRICGIHLAQQYATQLNFSCSLNVIFEVCANISLLDTGDPVETTLSSAEGLCKEQRSSAFSACITPYSMMFIRLTRGSSCDRKHLLENSCKDFEHVVQCFNNLKVTRTCRRQFFRELSSDANFACKLTDFQEVCTDAPSFDTVSETETQCEVEELNSFDECILPYTLSFAPLTSGPTCNKNIISKDICLNFANIVQCINDVKASKLCRRKFAEELHIQMNFACTLKDFQEVCPDAPVLNTVSRTQAICRTQELTDFQGCFYPRVRSFNKLGSGSSCNRELISKDLCRDFAVIVECFNKVNSSRSCRRHFSKNLRTQTIFSCHLKDFQQVCTNVSDFDTVKCFDGYDLYTSSVLTILLTVYLRPPKKFLQPPGLKEIERNKICVKYQ